MFFRTIDERSENIRLSKNHPGHFLVDLRCLWIIRGAVHQERLIPESAEILEHFFKC